MNNDLSDKELLQRSTDWKKPKHEIARRSEKHGRED